MQYKSYKGLMNTLHLYVIFPIRDFFGFILNHVSKCDHALPMQRYNIVKSLKSKLYQIFLFKENCPLAPGCRYPTSIERFLNICLLVLDLFYFVVLAPEGGGPKTPYACLPNNVF